MQLHVADGAAQERAKYAEIWSTIPEYREYSPGLENVDRFMSLMQPPVGNMDHGGASIIDIGCGEGKSGLRFGELGLNPWWTDITAAGLDPKVNRNRFIEAPLWTDWRHKAGGLFSQNLRWDYGYCVDVLEHIPTEYTMLVINRILQACGTAWLQIALRPDEFGKVIGEPLHLTVQPYSWWLLRIATLGTVIDARDLCGRGLFVVTK